MVRCWKVFQLVQSLIQCSKHLLLLLLLLFGSPTPPGCHGNAISLYQHRELHLSAVWPNVTEELIVDTESHS